MITKWFGNLGVWLCDRFSPRFCTRAEIAQSNQYVRLMIEVLRGTVPYYGRDNEGVVIVSENVCEISRGSELQKLCTKDPSK